jgi:Ca-activated chloride channel family protein
MKPKNLTWAVLGIFLLATLSPNISNAQRKKRMKRKDRIAAKAAAAVTTPTPPAIVPIASSVDSVKQGLIAFKTALNTPYFMIDSQNRQGYIYAEVKADSVVLPETKERTPLNISIVIDRSGSMAGEKLARAKEAAKFVIDNLDSRDFLSIVAYESDVTVVSPQGPVTNKEELKRKVDALTHAGSTKLSAGMKMGYRLVETKFNSEYVNRVLLMTDGLANKGKTAPSELKEIVNIRNRDKHMTLSTFGIGLDYNEDLLQEMAEVGTGNYYFISKAEDIPVIFERELSSLLTLAAKDVKLTVELPEGTKFNKMYGYTHQLIDNKVEVNFRDVFSKETKGVLIRFDIDDAVKDELVFNSQITFEDVLNNNALKTLKTQNKMLPCQDSTILKNGMNLIVQQQVVLFESNEMMAKAMKEIDEKKYEEARATTAANKAYIEKHEKIIEFNDEIEGEHVLIKKYSESIEHVESMGDAEVQEMQKSLKEINYKFETKRELDASDHADMILEEDVLTVPDVKVVPVTPKKVEPAKGTTSKVTTNTKEELKTTPKTNPK